MLSRNAHLVGGLEHDFYDFPYIGNVIIPTDDLIFFRGVETTNQK
jgi:nitrate reductase alpha subunit